MDRLSEYRIMWVLVLLICQLKRRRKRRLMRISERICKRWFYDVSVSIYVRHCASSENAAVHIKRVKSFLPELGHVGVMCITDKQFGDIELFYGKKAQSVNTPGQQLELF